MSRSGRRDRWGAFRVGVPLLIALALFVVPRVFPVFGDPCGASGPELWSDRFELVDDRTGEPLAGGEVWLAANGTFAVERVSLDSAALTSADAHECVAAVASPTHGPRFVLLAELLERRSQPLRVGLRESAPVAITFDAVPGRSRQYVDVALWAEGDEAWSDGRGVDVLARELRRVFLDDAPVAEGERLSSRERLEREAARSSLRAHARSLAGRERLALSGDEDLTLRARWSRTIAAPSNLRIDVPRWPVDTTLVGHFERSWSERWPYFAAIAPDGSHATGPALPARPVTSEDGAVVAFERSSGASLQVVFGEGNRAAWIELFDADGEPVAKRCLHDGSMTAGDRFGPLPPGIYELAAWIDRGQQYTYHEERVRLEASSETRLLLERPTDARVLELRCDPVASANVPDLFRPVLDRNLRWSVAVEMDGCRSARFHVTAEAGRVVELVGLGAVGGSFEVDGATIDVGGDSSGFFRILFLAGGGALQPPDLLLRPVGDPVAFDPTTKRVELRQTVEFGRVVRVEPIWDGEGVPNPVAAECWRTTDGMPAVDFSYDEYDESFDASWVDTGNGLHPPQDLPVPHARVRLVAPLGPCRVVLRATARTEDGLSAGELVGFTEFDLGRVDRVESIQLVEACSLVLRSATDPGARAELDAAGGLRPRGWTASTPRPLRWSPRDGAWSARLTHLVPNTDYEIVGTDRILRTGESGTTTVVDL